MPKKFIRKVGITFIVQGIVLLSFFLIYRLVAKNYGPDGVGEYSLVKRALGFLQPLLFLGLEIGIPRYIAMSSPPQRGLYLKAGFLSVVFLTLIASIPVVFIPDFFARIFFGSAQYSDFAVPFALFLAGFNIHALICCYFQGRLWIGRYNFLQLINLAVVPVAVLIVLNQLSLSAAILAMGVVNIILSLSFIPYLIRDLFSRASSGNFRQSFRDLINYSIGRLPGDFILAGMLSLSPIFAAHFITLAQVGYLSIGQSLVAAIGAIAAPLGTVLLPKVSNMIAAGRQESIRANVGLFISAILQLSVFVCFQMILVADLIVKFWLGEEFLAAVTVIRFSIFSAIFYFFYVSTRSVIDAISIKPINTINLAVSFTLFTAANGLAALLSGLVDMATAMNLAFAFGVVCLGSMTYRSIRELYPQKNNEDVFSTVTAVAINLILAVTVIAAKPFICSIFALLAFEAVMGIAYLLFLFLIKINWVRQIAALYLKR